MHTQENTNQLMRPPIGFQLSRSDDGSRQQSQQSHEHSFDETTFTDNFYVQALFKAFKEFLQEESEGCIFTELRLLKKIESARLLFKEDRKRFSRINDKFKG